MSKMPYDRKIISKDGELRDPNPRDMVFMLIGELTVLQRQAQEMLDCMRIFDQYMSGTKGWDNE